MVGERSINMGNGYMKPMCLNLPNKTSSIAD